MTTQYQTHRSVFVMAFGFLLFADSFGQAKEWIRFRGPNGTGISLAKGIRSKFTLDDANWRVALKGEGHSSPVLWGERVFVTGSNRMGDEFIVQCLNTVDGSEVWAVSRPQKSFRTHRYNHLSSSTPATNGEQLVLVVSKPGAHTLVALNLDGKPLWERTFDTIVSGHGGGISPILFDGKVILAGDEDNQSFLAAMDADTGKLLWKVDRINAKAAFSTPCEFTDPSGTRGLVFNSMGHGITFVDPRTGKTLWEQSGIFEKRSVSSSLVADGLLIGTCGSGGGGNYLVAVKPGRAAKGTPPSLAYKLRRAIPYVPTSVAKEGLLFLWGDSGVVTCAQAKTGELHWQERVEGRFFGSPVWVEGRLFCISTAGKMVVIAASDTFRSIAVNDLGEPSNATPALGGNRMYLRTLGHLISLGGAAK